jgi:hypothetical protein
MMWGFLFGLLFFIPVLGMAIGAGMGALMGKLTKTTIDRQFRDQVRDMVQPGTSALFLMLETVTPDPFQAGVDGGQQVTDPVRPPGLVGDDLAPAAGQQPQLDVVVAHPLHGPQVIAHADLVGARHLRAILAEY